MGKEKISIYDIAKEAGVSPATVSRVLTGNANVSSEKKARVEKLIKKHDFRPNAMARSLSNTKTKLIGYLTPDIRNPFYATLAVSCEQAAHEMGYSLLLCNYHNDMELQAENLQKMIEMRVDALLMIGGKVDETLSDEAYVEQINQITDRIPVIITGKLDGCDCHRVDIDQTGAMKLAMEHLISCGYKKISFIGGKKTVSSTYIKRITYMECLRKHGLSFQTEDIMESSYSIEDGYQAMNELFDRKGTVPDAVIAINDFVALGIIQSVREHGYEMPGDIGMVSFDDTFLAQSSTPRLTSVGYDYERFGNTLVSTAIAAIEGEELQEVQWISPEISIRESSGSKH